MGYWQGLYHSALIDMKQQLRKLFAPVLRPFESGSDTFAYQKSHRVTLIVMGCLFSFLSGAVLVSIEGNDPAYLLPVVIFALVGFLCLLIGLLGNDRAVAKIWGSR